MKEKEESKRGMFLLNEKEMKNERLIRHHFTSQEEKEKGLHIFSNGNGKNVFVKSLLTKAGRLHIRFFRILS